MWPVFLRFYFCHHYFKRLNFNSMTEYNHAAAVLILRVFLGIIVFIQGYDKVFNIGVGNVVKTILSPFAGVRIGKLVPLSAAYFTSYAELIGGLLILFGFMKFFALYLIGIDLLIVAFGFSLLNPMWDLRDVFPRLLFVAALLLLPGEWDVVSMDYVLELFQFARS
jgi:putative oxidoreductase